MALQKTITLANGSSGNYLKITKVVIDKAFMKLNIELSLFSDSSHGEPTTITGTPAVAATDTTAAVPAVPDKTVPPSALQQGFKVFSFPVTKDEAVGDILALGYAKIIAANNPALIGAISV